MKISKDVNISIWLPCGVSKKTDEMTNNADLDQSAHLAEL